MDALVGFHRSTTWTDPVREKQYLTKKRGRCQVFARVDSARGHSKGATPYLAYLRMSDKRLFI
jgi:hypothetical protein